MKKGILNIFGIVLIVTFLAGCKDKAKEANTTVAEKVAEVNIEAETYVADLAESTIEWKGFKPTGSHHGVINIESGELNTDDGKIASGSFLIDMSSITVLDIPSEDKGNAKLLGHLKSPDFFNVEVHPNAAFEITGLEEVNGKMMLSGNLALKDVKNNVTFPVTVSHEGDTLTLTSETFTIDRSKWNVQYGSKSFFDNLGDKFINDDIELKVNITAKK